MLKQKCTNEGLELLDNIVKTAHNNDSFKSHLVSDPESAISELLGKNADFIIPDGRSIVVEDQSNTSVIYLNIPVEPNLDEFELTDEQLNTVAGGGSTLVCVMAGAFSMGYALGGWVRRKLT